MASYHPTTSRREHARTRSAHTVERIRGTRATFPANQITVAPLTLFGDEGFQQGLDSSASRPTHAFGRKTGSRVQVTGQAAGVFAGNPARTCDSFEMVSAEMEAPPLTTTSGGLQSASRSAESIPHNSIGL
jgi:hypothetical protein